MAYRYGEDRRQMIMFPESVDSYITPDHPVRAYDAFVDQLNFKELGIIENDTQLGNSEYDPRLMLKLLLYGYSYGIKSSHKLERETHHTIPFIWLMKGLRPDYRTISRFRKQHQKSLRKALRLCAQLCLRLGLIEGNVLFVDGTKIRAAASRENNHTEAWYLEQDRKLNERIKQLLVECERIDIEEHDHGSLVSMRKELADAETLKSRIAEVMNAFKRHSSTFTKNGKARTINKVDPESALMKGRQGSHASYNVQSVVDEKHGLIVNVDATSDASDLNQFANQIQQASEVLEKKPTIACADAGYSDTEEQMKVQSDTTTVVVPSQKQALHKEEKPFSKSAFTYDKETDSYRCPEGHELAYEGVKEKDKKLCYRITDPNLCRACQNYGLCTDGKRGRTIIRLVNEEAKEQFERQYEDPSLQEIYKKRKMKVEHPFGYIKQHVGLTQFSMRGRDNATAESSIGATCFNITRMITIFGGVQAFITAVLTA